MYDKDIFLVRNLSSLDEAYTLVEKNDFALEIVVTFLSRDDCSEEIKTEVRKIWETKTKDLAGEVRETIATYHRLRFKLVN
jgi:hypothetical protein